MGKGTCHRGRQPEFDPQGLYSGQSELTPSSNLMVYCSYF